MKWFTISGKFLVPGTRKTVNVRIDRVVASDWRVACQSAAKFMTVQLKTPITGDFVALNLKVEDTTGIPLTRKAA